jgi:hypothetical protein
MSASNVSSAGCWTLGVPAGRREKASNLDIPFWDGPLTLRDGVVTLPDLRDAGQDWRCAARNWVVADPDSGAIREWRTALTSVNGPAPMNFRAALPTTEVCRE